MPQCLPLILSAGLFDSSDKFPGITKTQMRMVTTYELEYFFSVGGITIVNGNEYPIQPGKLLLAKPGDIRFSQLPFQCKFLHFAVSDSEIAEAINDCCGFFTVANPAEMDQLFSEITALHYAPDSLSHINAAAKLICLLYSLKNENSKDQTVLSRAQSYIENNYKDAISVDQIAEYCNVSCSYLHRLFQTRLHTTPGEMLLTCRISAACNLLVNTALSLGQISADCGFHSQSYFSDCFKRKVGISPKNFRINASYPL